MKWEYLEEDATEHVSLDRLNERGENGWELCATLPVDDRIRMVYKRAKPVYVSSQEHS